MNITFREVTEDDVQGILEIYNYYVEHTTISFHTMSIEAKEMREIVIFTNPRYRAYVISTEEEPLAGYVLLSQYSKRQAYDICGEVAIYLNPHVVGQGIGRKALDFIENFARQNDFHVLVATICGENERSRRLFENCGYFQCAHLREVGYKFGRLLDIVTFQKILKTT